MPPSARITNGNPDFDPISLFSMYMQVTGVPTLSPPSVGDPRLRGKKLGIINGASWIALWSNYFGRLFLPEVRLVNIGNEGVQLNFMRAHQGGQPCPPQLNIELFARYAKDLVATADVDAILISCSTMNRSLPAVQEAVEVPVVAIDLPMMERALELGRRVFVIATHGPTVKSTSALLQETGARLGREVELDGATVEEAFDLLGAGKITEHNELIAHKIEEACQSRAVDVVVLAQLSMSVFSLSYPEAQKHFGVPVLTSGEEGFRRMRQVLLESQ